MSDDKDKKWLDRASAAFSESTTYFDTSIRLQMEEDLRMFNGMHPTGSKYYSDSYKGRSKLFRPKTRSAMRRNEAIAAASFFSSEDVVNVRPNDDNDPQQSAGAAVMKELLQYRLTKTIPWFMTIIGAYQEAMKVGVVCSYQNWQYDEKKKLDRPWVELEPPENIRISPNAKWYDPINTSPYVIRMIPMFVKDVEERMTQIDPKTNQPKWRKYERGDLLSAVNNSDDSIRQTREGNRRSDPKQSSTDITDFTVVWIHENFINIDGEDWVYFTLGSDKMLTDPKPLREVYFHGIRPVVMGICIIETHKVYSSSQANLGKDVQREVNEIANLRIDNVRFAMNKRYFVRRSQNVDLRSLTRNVPSSVTLMNDIEKDVKVVETNDVTASAYQEQDRLNNDFDELMGHFSSSSVNSNRRLNETVGGLELLTDDANQVSEYQLRTFVETWVEPVLRQLMLLEQQYETDKVILKLAGEKASIIKNWNISQIDDALLEQDMTLTVNVGIGATNPSKQVERFVFGMKALREMLGDGIMTRVDTEQVVTELFGKLGYKDGKRFFRIGEDEDMVYSNLMDQIDQLQQALEAKHPPELLKAMVDEIQSKIAERNVNTLKAGVEAQYAAVQAAGAIAMAPEIGEVADQVLANADPGQQYTGFGDNLPPQPTGPITELAYGQKNTSPMSPPVAPQPASPFEGNYQGIETQEPSD